MINECKNDHYICILFYCTSNDPPEMILWRFTTQSFLHWDIMSQHSFNTLFQTQKTIERGLYSSITINTMLYCIQNGALQLILWCFTTQSFLQWDIMSHFASNTPNWIPKSIAIGLYSSITIITMLYCTEIGALQMILWRLFTCIYM